MHTLVNLIWYELHYFEVLGVGSSKEHYFYHPIQRPRNQTEVELDCYIRLFLRRGEVDVLLVIELLVVDKLSHLTGQYDPTKSCSCA